MPFCTECGLEISDGNKFCGNCGAPLSQTAKKMPPAMPPLWKDWRRIKVPILIAAFLILAGTAYVWATPYLAVRSIRQAINAGRYAELMSVIALEPLRESLKVSIASGLTAALKEESEGKGEPVPEGATAMGSALIGAAIDSVLTPDRLKQADFALTQLTKLLEQEFGKAPPDLKQTLQRAIDSLTYRSRYVGLNSFAVEARAGDQWAVEFVFTRSGLTGWKLSEVHGEQFVLAFCRYAGLIQGPLHKLARTMSEVFAGRGSTNRAAIGALIREAVAKGYNPNSSITVTIAGGLVQIPLLILAIELRDAEAAQALLQAGANPNAQDAYGFPALHVAVNAQPPPNPAAVERIVALLLKRGADPKARNRDGDTALDLAKRYHELFGDPSEAVIRSLAESK